MTIHAAVEVSKRPSAEMPAETASPVAQSAALTLRARTFNSAGVVPAELTDIAQWVCWRYVNRAGKAKSDKVPMCTRSGRNLEWQDQRNWLTYEAAVAGYKADTAISGIGLVLRRENGLVGIDMDRALDRATGEIAEWAREHVGDVNTYTEVSPSGEGFRMFVLGTLPSGCRKKVGKREIYNDGRWLTITGNVFNDSPIVRNDAAVKRYLAAMGANPVTALGSAVKVSNTTAVVDTATIADLRSALAYLRADDRDLWMAIAHDLSELGDIGRGLWIEWSQTSDKYEAGDAKQWDTVKDARSGYRNVFKRAAALGWINPASRAASRDAMPTARAIAAPPTPQEIGGDLPADAEVLRNLPYGLGQLQSWIEARAMYPSFATAGVTALAVLAHCSMAHVTVDSFHGLGLGEFFLTLAPTGSGKEDLRAPIAILDKYVRSQVVEGMNLRAHRLPALQWSAPASLQGLHALLEARPTQTLISDEFAEWLTQSHVDGHRQAALGYLMQLYSAHHGTVNAPSAVTRTYNPVERPRVIVFATSTAERMLTAMTGGQAESGAYNRFVIHVADQGRISKRYSGFAHDPPANVLALVDWITSLPETVMKFAPGAWDVYVQQDSEVVEPIRHSDNVMGARLSEQAIKMAALIALSDRRTSIDRRDLEIAYAIRLSMYRRAAVLIRNEGAINGMHQSGKAVEQLTRVFSRHQAMRRAHLPNYSRAYKALTTNERNSVVSALLSEGTVTARPDSPGMLFAVDV